MLSGRWSGITVILETIVYCKANPKVTVIKAIGLVFDKMRKERGIVLAK